tara:strand:- start:792 stop:1835 length:1044 start_codon:yes stop_codon:yes gene_type:complete
MWNNISYNLFTIYDLCFIKITMPEITQKKALKIASEVISSEIRSIKNIQSSLDSNFFEICKLLNSCKGKVVIMGVGKSGHIARKIAATFSSTGTPSMFLHPSEAAHGDAGAIEKKDVVILISKSGETPEIVTILPIIKEVGNKIISLVCKSNSTIATSSDIFISNEITNEACPLNLSPTSSSTICLVIGDAISAVLMTMKNFTGKDFATYHPGGQLGKNLNIKIKDIMKKNREIPLIASDNNLISAIDVMTKKGLGFVIIVNKNKKIVGIFTDGDLRRFIKTNKTINNVELNKIINKNFSSCSENDLALDVLNKMNKEKISAIPVIDKDSKVIGATNMFYLVKSGIS